MPTATPSHALSEPLLELLLWLGRRGASLRTTAQGVVLEASTSAMRRVVVATTVAEARAAGFLVPMNAAAETSSLILSAVGRAALRQALMLDGSLVRQLSGSNVARGRKRQDDDAASSGNRHPLRRSLLEQLATRRDGRGKPLLGAAHLTAGERFAADYQKAGLQPRVTARWSAEAATERRRRSAPGAGQEIGDAAAAAQVRVRKALAALGGTLANVVLDVCGLERNLAAVEAERGWPRGAGWIVLAGALEQLAHHYGLIAQPRSGAGGIVQWGDGDHRPPGPEA